MSRNELTGDWITRHPVITGGIIGGVIGLIAGYAAKKIRREQAIKEQYMEENPYETQKFAEEFYFFSFGISLKEAEDLKDDEDSKYRLLEKWNFIHPKKRWRNSIDPLDLNHDEDFNIRKIVTHWETSQRYYDLTQEDVERYLHRMESKLILQGKL